MGKEEGRREGVKGMGMDGSLDACIDVLREHRRGKPSSIAAIDKNTENRAV